MPGTKGPWFLYFNKDKTEAVVSESNNATAIHLRAPGDEPKKLNNADLKAAFEANARKAAAGQAMFKALSGLLSAAQEAGLAEDHPAIKDALRALEFADPPLFKVTRDGVDRFSGTHNECWTHILKSQAHSVDHAIKYEGWKIEPLEVAPEAEAAPTP